MNMGVSLWDQAWMDRHPVAISAATGSFSGTLLWLLRDLVFSNSDPSLDLRCPICQSIETPSLNFWAGICVGFLLWPLLELLVLTKQWLTVCLRAKISALNREGRVYKVLG